MTTNSLVRGDWMQTWTGRQFYPLTPTPDDIDPLDIAHALSMLCRYNGHVDRFYSVAEHCVLMSDVMPTRELALEALLHDASEAYIGDMVSPLKHAGAMHEYKRVERRIENAVHKRFGLPFDIHHVEGMDFYFAVKSPIVKDADSRILLTERAALMSTVAAPWVVEDMTPLDVEIRAWSPAEAEAEYRRRLIDLDVFMEKGTE